MSSKAGAQNLAETEAVYGFAENAEQGRALAAALGFAFIPVDVHTFPDGESRVGVTAAAPHAIVLRSLHQPNKKLVELLLAASALRDTGAVRLTLVAPYLAYMRQDKAFHRGEAVSQKVMGRLLAGSFDRFVSVDPHLHRTPSLDAVFLGKPALTLTAAPAISAHIKQRPLFPDTLVVGPDEESQPWVAAVAGPLNLPWATAVKQRHGDRSVTITVPDDIKIEGRPILVIDDVISSGGTLRTLAGLLRGRGAGSIEAYTTHALFSEEDEDMLRGAGITAIYSCNSVPHRTNAIDLIPTLTQGLNQWR